MHSKLNSPNISRIFDFFDPGIMAGIRHLNHDLETSHSLTLSMDPRQDSVTFKAKATALRRNPWTGKREARVRWVPENL